MRVLIADDEAPARRQLRRALDGLEGVDLVGEAATGLEALTLAAAHRPDLLILDIQMPGMSGLDVAANLPRDCLPQIVFATAFDEYAVRAFELAAVDYLLKPWDVERLSLAVDRARQRVGERTTPIPTIAGSVRRVIVRDDDALRVIDCAEVVSIRADDNQVLLHTRTADWALREPLSALLERLNYPDFLRVHRSHAVNLREVREMIPLHKGDGDLIMADGLRVPYSRTCRETLVARLGG